MCAATVATRRNKGSVSAFTEKFVAGVNYRGAYVHPLCELLPTKPAGL